MNLTYTSTRGHGETVTASQAILKGLADDGGLFVPTALPKLDVPMTSLAEMSYQEVAYEVMKLFLTDFTEEELKNCIARAYDSKFDTEVIAPLVQADGVYFLELFHGNTIAFKDMALSILPHLMTTAAKKNNVNNEIVILTATSGDTGKAAMAGFADVPGTRIIVFYPKHGVSPVQEKQMVTQKGENTFVVGIEGNFDDAQTGVKKMFNDKKLAEELGAAGFQFSSANSINIGRLVPQVVYYVYAYANLVKNEQIRSGDFINITVPTGNFGNILAAYYAKLIGLPVNKLICASNTNKVLFDFFTTGTYDRKREFTVTSSPSMDILISSNLERLIYRIAGNDPEKNAAMMQALTGEGEYSITDEMKKELKDFYGNYADEQETAEAIKALYEDTGYVIDTHTAVAAAVYKKYVEDANDVRPTVIASTASPFKFARSVMTAIDSKYSTLDEFELVDELVKISNTEEPEAVKEIRTAPVRHDHTCSVDGMENTVKQWLGIK
ncbi:MAG: threonine synthase [Clostridia bacterium]|nr:threonine synthase [Lachnospiraceae bacterium]NCC01335.1 threonine synthase [Clostridia bacterium]NCD03181.1 threonine synthase [Clostridia bacterium]